MKCPKCRHKTHVLETRSDERGVRRRRECLSPKCAFKWTTIEALFDDGAKSIERPEELILGGTNPRTAEPTPGALTKRKGIDSEAVAAALRVDARKQALAREAKAARAQNREYYVDSGFDPAPDRLTPEQLRREMEGY